MQVPVYEWEFRENPIGDPVKWHYWIDLDERGEFKATVYNSSGRAVYSIDGFEIFEDGFMKYKEDVHGLEEYLKSLGVMPKSARLIYASPGINPLTKSETENVLAEAEIHSRIPRERYQGQAEGMTDIAEQYGTNPTMPIPEEFEVKKMGKTYAIYKKVNGRKVLIMAGLMDPQAAAMWIYSGFKQMRVNPVVPFRHRTGSSSHRALSAQTIRDVHYTAAIQNVMEMTGAKYEIAKSYVDKMMRDMMKRRSPIRGKVIPFLGNPPVIHGKIYQRCMEIRGSKAGMPHDCDDRCKAANHLYKHPFKQNACIYALTDGSVLVR